MVRRKARLSNERATDRVRGHIRFGVRPPLNLPHEVLGTQGASGSALGRECMRGPTKPLHHGVGTSRRVRPGRKRLDKPRITGWGSCAWRRSSVICIALVISS